MLENAQNNNHQNNQPTTLIIKCTKNELTTIIYNCAVAFVATGKGYFYWGTFFNLWHCDQISNVKYLSGSMHWYFYLESLDQSSQIQWLKTASEAAASSYSQEEGLKFIDYYRTVGLGQQEIVDQENKGSMECPNKKQKRQKISPKEKNTKADYTSRYGQPEIGINDGNSNDGVQPSTSSSSVSSSSTSSAFALSSKNKQYWDYT